VDNIVPRWEWRTWGTSFGGADARFAALKPEMVQESDEIYLVSSVTDRAVKIRMGLMDIKSLQEVNSAGLEQWRPILKAKLPLSREHTEGVLAALGASLPAPGKDDYTLDELLLELAAEKVDVRAVPLHKERVHYTVGGCMAEMTEVLVVGEQARTVAIESTDADRVIAVVRDLGLSGYPNTSYPRWLKATMGIGT
jgi:exopolyphosphatase/guanosine-5'-triphosphate,3'-diphosphate pyrophosphatase